MQVTLERSAQRFLVRNPYPTKFRHLLRVTEATSRFPERDTLILLLCVTCGMRLTEIARLEVHHVLAKSGPRRRNIPAR